MTLDPTADSRIPPGEATSEDQADSLEYADFTIGDEIGNGGNATVYEATVETDLNDRAAIKTVTWGNQSVTRADIDAFTTESETWERVHDHPHIATVYGYGINPSPWIATEYLAGRDLSERIPLEDPLEALWIGSAVADAVQHAHHKGTTHSDLKPSNVLLEVTSSEKWDRPKVIDWGLATPLEDRNDPDGVTPPYAPPEQIDPSVGHDVGPHADVYQLGAFVYALLTGEPPRRTASSATDETSPIAPPSAIRSSLPDTVDAVVLDALASVPTERTRTAAQFGTRCAAAFRELAESDQDRSESTEQMPSTAPGGSTEGSVVSTTHSRSSNQQNNSASEAPPQSETGSPNDDEPTNPRSPEPESERWFTPRSDPTALSRSLSQRLQALANESQPSKDSLGDALRSISRTRDTHRLSHRLSKIHEMADEQQ